MMANPTDLFSTIYLWDSATNEYRVIYSPNYSNDDNHLYIYRIDRVLDDTNQTIDMHFTKIEDH